MKIENIKNELLKNGGITFNKDLTSASNKNGYYVSIIGYEKIIKIEELEKTIKEYQQKLLKNEYIGLWIDNNKIYIDISKHYTDKKRAIESGIKNKQIAIYDILNNNNIYLLKDTYILYKYNKINNDIKYIKEYFNIKDLQKEFNINNIYQFIYKDIDKLKDNFKLLKDKYIIIKDNMLYREFLEIMEG